MTEANATELILTAAAHLRDVELFAQSARTAQQTRTAQKAKLVAENDDLKCTIEQSLTWKEHDLYAFDDELRQEEPDIDPTGRYAAVLKAIGKEEISRTRQAQDIITTAHHLLSKIAA